MTENGTIIDRPEPGFFEADDEGYITTPDEPGPDGRAKGIEFALYVRLPQYMMRENGGITFDPPELTDDEVALFFQWIEEQYPGIDWNFDADEDATATVYDDFREGEDAEALMMRLTVNNPEYNRLRNEWTIYYHGLHRFLDYVKEHRQPKGAS